MRAQTSDFHSKFPPMRPDGYSGEPSGGFSYGGRMYVFVTKRMTGQHVQDLININLPGDIMLQSFLVSRLSQCDVFQLEFAGSPIDQFDPILNDGHRLRFINIAARIYHNNGELGAGIPNGDILLLWGTGLYHLSEVFFAWASLSGGPVPDPSQWNYLTSESPPQFTVGQLQIDPTQLAALALPIPPNMGSVSDGGEISVTWLPGINRWLMLVSSGAAIGFGFVAPKPWGPWTPVQLFDVSTDPTFDIAADDYTIEVNPLPQPGLPFARKWYGYGNYIIDRFTAWDGMSSALSVYFILSINSVAKDTHGNKDPNSIGPDNYYGTFLVKAVLRCT